MQTKPPRACSCCSRAIQGFCIPCCDFSFRGVGYDRRCRNVKFSRCLGQNRLSLNQHCDTLVWSNFSTIQGIQCIHRPPCASLHGFHYTSASMPAEPSSRVLHGGSSRSCMITNTKTFSNVMHDKPFSFVLQIFYALTLCRRSAFLVLYMCIYIFAYTHAIRLPQPAR